MGNDMPLSVMPGRSMTAGSGAEQEVKLSDLRGGAW
jgi:hypothetical protein